MEQSNSNNLPGRVPLAGNPLVCRTAGASAPSYTGGPTIALLGVGNEEMSREENGNVQGGEICLVEEREKSEIRDSMSQAICLYDNDMELTGASDSESWPRQLRSSTTRGRAKQAKNIGKKRRLNPGSSSESDAVESKTASTQGTSRKAEFLKPRVVDSGEDAIQEMARTATLARASLGISTSADTATLKQQVSDDVDVILQVASKSKNLKGTFVRALKDAGSSIKEAVESLSLKFSAEEAAKLQAENLHLRREVTELRKEMADLRQEVRRKNSNPIPMPSPSESPASKKTTVSVTPQAPQTADELARSIMIQVGNMMDARMASLEQRLPPEKRIRPPLVADRRNVANATAQTQQPRARVDPVVESEDSKDQRGKKGRRKAATTKSASAEQTGPNSQTSSSKEQWTKVGKGGKPAKYSEMACQTNQ